LTLLRSLAYQVFLTLSVALFGGAIAIVGPWVPFRLLAKVARIWARANLIALKSLCRLDYRIEGLEHLPTSTCIVMSKHQSAWETIALRALLPVEHSWVLKRELLDIPILGAALRRFRVIAIDRSAGRAALKQLVTEGQRLLDTGHWVVIFPEGTRVPPGERAPYNVGGALLAQRSGYPILPIAHNAGVFWGRRSLIKRAGTIQLVIGESINSTGKSAQELSRETENWIEGVVAGLPTRADFQGGPTQPG
jgi:1-acyl-sn-glycerol-3-phosphate acyltransferase